MSQSESLCVAFVGSILGGHSNQTPHPFEEISVGLQARGFRCILTSPVLNRPLRFGDMIRSLILHRDEIDVLCISIYAGRGFLFEDATSWLGQLLGKPILMVVHGGAVPEFIRQFPRWSRRVIDRSTLIASPSHYLIEALSSFGYTVSLLPNPLDISKYPFRPRCQVEPKLVWLRAMHKTYNPADAVQTCLLLRNEFPHLMLTLVGPDKGDGTLQEIQKLIQENVLSDCVKIVGGIPRFQVPYYLDQGDIFINTTSYESFGISVMEAAACGLCIITTNVGEIPYIWRNDNDALLVEPRSPVALANAVKRILFEPGLATRLSYAGRRKAEQYSMPGILDQWERILLHIA
jgi:glycosyltransferase involved in cell wall biosynthesis